MNKKKEIIEKATLFPNNFESNKLSEEEKYVGWLYRQQMILADYYSIFITCIPSIETGEDKWTTNIGAGRKDSLFDTYIEALEDGIIRALKKINVVPSFEDII